MTARVVLAKAHGAALLGVTGILVEVEAARVGGLPRTTILGQASIEVREGRERLGVALRAAGLWTGEEAIHPVILNLAPAGLRKAGTGLDLPMCLAVAALTDRSLAAALGRVVATAEVGLDGRLRPAPGTVAAAAAARERGFRAILVPPETAREAGAVGGLEVLPVDHLAAAVAVLRGRREALAPLPPEPPPAPARGLDLADVRGQHLARRALEVAAAGGHNLLLVGPPGSGKTMLARRLPSILPPLSREEALEVTRIHSAAGLVPPGTALFEHRPFRAPHHGASLAGLVGGGVPPRPGEVTLATHGVLFLDELPEFPRALLEALRQPLEDGEVAVVRAAGRVVFPARFVLVAAMNPCPCGWLGSGVRACRCSPRLRERYRGRVSGPLLDRIDLHVEVPAVRPEELEARAPGESSALVRERVVAARRVQLERNRGVGAAANATLAPPALRQVARPAPAAARLLRDALARLGLSARSRDRVLRVARTLADLDGSERIEARHVAEAVRYRVLDRASGADPGER